MLCLFFFFFVAIARKAEGAVRDGGSVGLVQNQSIKSYLYHMTPIEFSFLASVRAYVCAPRCLPLPCRGSPLPVGGEQLATVSHAHACESAAGRFPSHSPATRRD